VTILNPGIEGITIGPILKPASIGRKYSREKLNKKGCKNCSGNTAQTAKYNHN